MRAQGNTLRGVGVVDLAYQAADTDGTLAERLLAGLEAGRARAGAGIGLWALLGEIAARRRGGRG